MRCLAGLAAVLFSALFGSAAAASTLSLDFQYAVQTSRSQIVLDDATIRLVSGDELFLYRPNDWGMPPPGGFCAIDGNYSCIGDAEVLFTSPVDNLQFGSFFQRTGDVSTITVFSGDTELTEFTVAAATTIDLSAYSAITRLLIDGERSSSHGIAYGEFYFTRHVEVIPLPPAMPALLSGLLLVGFLKRGRPGRRAS